MNKLNKSIKIYRKILSMFFVVVVPLFICCVLVYSIMASEMNESHYQEQKYKAERLLENTNSELDRVKMQMNAAVASNDVKKTTYFKAEMTPVEYTVTVTSILEQLKQLASSSIYTDYAVLYMNENRTLIASDDNYDSMTEEEYKTLVAQINSGYAVYENEFYLTQLSGYDKDASNPDVMIWVRLNKSAFSDKLNELIGPENGKACLYFNDMPITACTEEITGKAIEISDGAIRLKWDIDNLMRRNFVIVAVLFCAFLLIMSIVILAYVIYIQRTINKPFLKLISGLEAIEDGQFGYEITEGGEYEFAYIYNSFNKMSKRLKSEIDKSISSQVMLETAGFKELQAQINPHFLFNTLFLLKYFLRQENNEAAMQLAGYLGDYFKYTCSIHDEETDLKSELIHVKNYISIQKLRFGDKISCNIEETSEEADNSRIPRLIIQPLVENVFKYVVDKRSGSEFALCAKKDGNVLTVCVEDNGQITDEKIAELNSNVHHEPVPGTVSALVNINRRLELKYGLDSGLIFSRSSLGGLKATLTIIYSESRGDDANV